MEINGIFKLVPNLNNKNNNILFFRETLRQAAHNGLKITKLNRILEFDQTSTISILK